MNNKLLFPAGNNMALATALYLSGGEWYDDNEPASVVLTPEYLAKNGFKNPIEAAKKGFFGKVSFNFKSSEELKQAGEAFDAINKKFDEREAVAAKYKKTAKSIILKRKNGEDISDYELSYLNQVWEEAKESADFEFLENLSPAQKAEAVATVLRFYKFIKDTPLEIISNGFAWESLTENEHSSEGQRSGSGKLIRLNASDKNAEDLGL